MSEENSGEIERLDESVVRELCHDYARMTRVNISEEHGQVFPLVLSIKLTKYCLDCHTNSRYRRTDLHLL